MQFGAADCVHDVRLACQGVDRDDNDFVIGLIGKDLYPLSAVAQVMRKTQQASLYLDRLGPFFIGRTGGPSARGGEPVVVAGTAFAPRGLMSPDRIPLRPFGRHAEMVSALGLGGF